MTHQPQHIESSIESLQQALSQVMITDRYRLSRQLDKLKKRAREGKPADKLHTSLEQEIAASVEKAFIRNQSVPSIEYPHELPITAKVDDVVELIKQHQVVILCGETGSGKSTQLPKICLDAGLGRRGMIGHTQPRRLAARSLASRIATELKSEVGSTVGYQVRFNERVGENTLIKLMTDGILLSEIQHDRYLNKYEVIIIDEAHERSLNIDFILGFLKQLLPERPDLKVIVTSATIDPESFSRHFNDAPVIEVSGRTYPVDVLYRPIEDDDDTDIASGVVKAVKELRRFGMGDILCFLPGERAIREVADTIAKAKIKGLDVMPLYARLGIEDQMKVFSGHGGQRIVLATNVAETSVTVPGIHYVIDTGQARISRYSYKTKISRLPIEQISKASADQRKGRCGRIASGVCIRLYDEQTFEDSADYTEPEIRRTNLAAVILRMKYQRLGEIEMFPFIDPPDRKLIQDGYKLLFELGATDEKQNLTPLGKQLAPLPIDPRIGRMLLAAKNEGCLQELLIIGSFLEVQDPRERPIDQRGAADEAHAGFRDERSDFLGILNIWNEYHSQKKALSGNQLKRWCRECFLSSRRMREWVDVYRQLKDLIKEMKMTINEAPANYGQIHRSLLSGLLANIAVIHERGVFQGARNIKLKIFPDSALHKKHPKWIVAAELMETSQNFARMVAGIEPQWVEKIAKHLVHHNYYSPTWDQRSGRVNAFDKITLYGLVINPGKKVDYSRIDPLTSRELLIRSAFVDQNYSINAPFYRHNCGLIEDILDAECRERRRDILVHETEIFSLYDQRIPAGISSMADFESWRKEAEKENSTILFFNKDDLLLRPPDETLKSDFPDTLECNGVIFPLEYGFEPGEDYDGATVRVPLEGLMQLEESVLSWGVPGYRFDKIVAMIKALPKPVRRKLVPAPDWARRCIEEMPVDTSKFFSEVVAHQLFRLSGETIDIALWAEMELPSYLVITIKVIGPNGNVLSIDNRLSVLIKRFETLLRDRQKQGLESKYERDDLSHWDFEELPEEVEVNKGGVKLKAYPYLQDEQGQVNLKLTTDPAFAKAQTKKGILQFILRDLAKELRYLKKNLPDFNTIALLYSTIGAKEGLLDDILTASLRDSFDMSEGVPRTRKEYEQLVSLGRNRLIENANETCRILEQILEQNRIVQVLLKKMTALAYLKIRQDIQSHIDHLIYEGFVRETPRQWLKQFSRYLTAVERRIEKVDIDPKRDGQRAALIDPWFAKYLKLTEKFDAMDDEQFQKFRWMIEEWRVSIFAQELKTVETVSEKRLEKLYKEITRTRPKH